MKESVFVLVEITAVTHNQHMMIQTHTQSTHPRQLPQHLLHVRLLEAVGLQLVVHGGDLYESGVRQHMCVSAQLI